MEIKTTIASVTDGKEYPITVDLALSGEGLGNFDNANVKVKIENKKVAFTAALEYDMPVFLADEENVKSAKSLSFEAYEAARIAAQAALYVVGLSRQSGSCMLPGYSVLHEGRKLGLMLVSTDTDDTDTVAVLYGLRNSRKEVYAECALGIYDYDDVRDACTDASGVVPEEIAQYEQIKGTKYAYNKDCHESFKDLIERDPGVLTAICTTRLKVLNFDIETEFDTVLDLEIRPLGFSVVGR